MGALDGYTGALTLRVLARVGPELIPENDRQHDLLYSRRVSAEAMLRI
jgi:hypothetical protein